MIIAKLELYAVALVVILIAMGGAYFKGGSDRERKIHTEEAAQLTTALQTAAVAAQARAASDDAARLKADALLKTLDDNLLDLDKRFAHVPQVVVDTRGCATVAPAFRVRWNSLEALLPTSGQSSSSVSAALPSNSVPAR